MKNRGFTLIELVVVIAIIAILYGVILFSVTQYINRGKDSNIFGNMNILIPAGETFYNGNGNSYSYNNKSFCDPTVNSVINNVMTQMPKNPAANYCYRDPITLMHAGPMGAYTIYYNPAGLCCLAQSQAWVACATEFSNPNNSYCVDSRGMKEETANNCTSIYNNCLGSNICQCP
jgi:prepilin-type N-terminal cleavage/methylation domain-containing protein